MKFLGVILDEHLSWKEHINLVESKISKNIGIMYKAKYLNINCLKNIYYSFIHSYINYCNIAWASTYCSKLIKIYNHQKHAIRLIMNANRYDKSQPLMKQLGVLNIYQINIQQVLILMFKLKYEMGPKVFQNKFSTVHHKYPTRHALNCNYLIPKTTLRMTDFSINCRGPKLWNKFLTREMKVLTSLPKFKYLCKQKLLNTENVDK